MCIRDRKNEEGKEIRAAIKPQRPGWLLLSADYSQIELRVMAFLSQDTHLLEAFRRSQDIHRYTASRLFDIPWSEVDENQRRIGKMINFSIIYGVSSFGLSSRLGIGRKDAEKFIDAYFRAYPGIKDYMNAAIALANSDGIVRTLYGRLRRIPFIAARNPGLRKEAERVAINSPVQGTAADVIKIAMIRIYERLKREGLQARLILQLARGEGGGQRRPARILVSLILCAARLHRPSQPGGVERGIRLLSLIHI